jgi:hypothetical protein
LAPYVLCFYKSRASRPQHGTKYVELNCSSYGTFLTHGRINHQQTTKMGVFQPLHEVLIGGIINSYVNIGRNVDLVGSSDAPTYDDVKNQTSPRLLPKALMEVLKGGMYEQTQRGAFFNYNTLPHSAWETIFPDYFGVDVNEQHIERMKAMSGTYSKAGRKSRQNEWEDDTSKNLSEVTKKQRKAALKYLDPLYEAMEDISKRQSP